MKKIRKFLVHCGICLLLTLTGCTGKNYIPPTLSKEAVVVHKYHIDITDEKNTPIEGATIEYTLIVPGYSDVAGKIITGKDGIVRIEGKTHSGTVLQPNGSIYTYAGNASTLKYIISKQYHFSINDKINFTCPRNNSTDDCTNKINAKLNNYVDKDIKAPLRGKIEGVVSRIMLEAFVRESLLVNDPVSLEKFKDNLYLKMNFISLNKYNSIKLNKYDVGKILFDDILRKILTHLDEDLRDSKEFNGYVLTVTTYLKNFVDEKSKDVKVEYKFYLPKKIVTQYKEMDISGQKLLDSSVILQNGERVELKLQ